MPPIKDLDFIHVFFPADPPNSNAVTLLLLHGTGGRRARSLTGWQTALARRCASRCARPGMGNRNAPIFLEACGRCC